jgi:hypothetical protein
VPSNADDVRRIALALPGATQDGTRLRFLVDGNAFAWAWMKRVEVRHARVEQGDVIAVPVAGEDEKRALMEARPGTFFTEPHDGGLPAVLVRLPAIENDELAELLAGAWRLRRVAKCDTPGAED